VGDLPLDAQVKLLRVLSTGEVTKIGDQSPVTVGVRLVAATHRDLRKAVGEGSFREDLYYRLAIFEIRTPALREIAADIPGLVQHFLATDALALDRGIRRVSSTAVGALARHPWPGNVRELENAIRRACVVCDGETLLLEHLPESVTAGSVAAGAGPVACPSGTTLAELERSHIERTLKECGGNLSEAARRLGVHRNTLHRKLSGPERPDRARA